MSGGAADAAGGAGTDGAVAAAVALGRRLGLPQGGPVLLHEGSNAVVHLAPAPVVARVALLTARARPRPAEALAREVHLAGWLAGHGAAVVPPTGVVEAGPHEQDGWVVSLWPHLPVRSDGSGHLTGAPEAVGAALAALHDVLAGYEAQRLPGLSEAVADAVRCLQVGGGWLPAGLRDALEDGARDAEERAAALDAETGAGRPLHGDPHPRNLLRLGPTALWCDLEDAVRAPVEWDLAVLARSRQHDGAVAVRAWAATSGTAPDADRLAACQEVRAWQVQAWTALSAHTRPGEREAALAGVATWAASRPGPGRA